MINYEADWTFESLAKVVIKCYCDLLSDNVRPDNFDWPIDRANYYHADLFDTVLRQLNNRDNGISWSIKYTENEDEAA